MNPEENVGTPVPEDMQTSGTPMENPDVMTEGNTEETA